MKKILISLAFVFSAAAALAGNGGSVPAPDFRLAKVLNAPVSAIHGPADLKGKVVFIEFWATWCPTCVADFPHVDQLVEEMKGKPVVIIAVTDEDPVVVAKFLETHKLNAWVGIDRKRSVLKAFKVKVRPDGYLLGKDGSLLARVYPSYLDANDLLGALSGHFTPRPFQGYHYPPGLPCGADTKTPKPNFHIKPRRP